MQHLAMIPAALLIEEGEAIVLDTDLTDRGSALHELAGSTPASPFRNEYTGELDSDFANGYLLGLMTAKAIYAQGGKL